MKQQCYMCSLNLVICNFDLINIINFIKSQDNFVASGVELLMNRNDYLTLAEKQAEILGYLLKVSQLKKKTSTKVVHKNVSQGFIDQC